MAPPVQEFLAELDEVGLSFPGGQYPLKRAEWARVQGFDGDGKPVDFRLELDHYGEDEGLRMMWQAPDQPLLQQIGLDHILDRVARLGDRLRDPRTVDALQLIEFVPELLRSAHRHWYPRNHSPLLHCPCGTPSAA